MKKTIIFFLTSFYIIAGYAMQESEKTNAALNLANGIMKPDLSDSKTTLLPRPRKKEIEDKRDIVVDIDTSLTTQEARETFIPEPNYHDPNNAKTAILDNKLLAKTKSFIQQYIQSKGK